MSGRDEQVVLVRGRDGVVRAMNRGTGRIVAEFDPDAPEHDDRLRGWSLVLAWFGALTIGWMLLYVGAHILAAHLRSLG